MTKRRIAAVLAVMILVSSPLLAAATYDHSDHENGSDSWGTWSPSSLSFEHNESVRSKSYDLVYDSLMLGGMDAFPAKVVIDGEVFTGYGVVSPDGSSYVDDEGRTWLDAAFLSVKPMPMGHGCRGETIERCDSFRDISYVWTFDVEMPDQQFILNDRYGHVHVENGSISIAEKELSSKRLESSREEYMEALKEVYDPAIGTELYSFDKEGFEIDLGGLGERHPITGVSLSKIIDSADLKEHIEMVLKNQDNSIYSEEIESIIHCSKNAVLEYLNTKRCSQLCSIPVDEIRRLVEESDPLSMLSIDDNGLYWYNVSEPPPQPSLCEIWFAKLLMATTILASIVLTVAVTTMSMGAAVPILMAAGAAIGVASDIYTQVVVMDRPMSSLNLTSLLISGVAGVLCSLPGVGLLGGAFVGGVASAAIAYTEGVTDVESLTNMVLLGTILGSGMGWITGKLLAGTVHVFSKTINHFKGPVYSKDGGRLTPVPDSSDAYGQYAVGNMLSKSEDCAVHPSGSAFSIEHQTIPVKNPSDVLRKWNVSELEYFKDGGNSCLDMREHAVTLNGKPLIGSIDNLKPGEHNHAAHRYSDKIQLDDGVINSQESSRGARTVVYSPGNLQEQLLLNPDGRFILTTYASNYDQCISKLALNLKMSQHDLKFMLKHSGEPYDVRLAHMNSLCEHNPHLDLDDLMATTEHKLTIHEQIVPDVDGIPETAGVAVPEELHQAISHHGANAWVKENMRMHTLAHGFSDRSGRHIEITEYKVESSDDLRLRTVAVGKDGRTEICDHMLASEPVVTNDSKGTAHQFEYFTIKDKNKNKMVEFKETIFDPKKGVSETERYYLTDGSVQVFDTGYDGQVSARSGSWNSDGSVELPYSTTYDAGGERRSNDNIVIEYLSGSPACREKGLEYNTIHYNDGVNMVYRHHFKNGLIVNDFFNADGVVKRVFKDVTWVNGKMKENVVEESQISGKLKEVILEEPDIQKMWDLHKKWFETAQ